MAYKAPSTLPWGRIAGPWQEAEEQLARLDQTLRTSPLRDAWLARAAFEEAAAALWLEGAVVPLEDLVLYDANTAFKLPSPELFRARAVLLSRRSLARQGPQALTEAAILALKERREKLTAEPPALPHHNPDWDTRSRVLDWLGVVGETERFPPLPAAAVALHAWERLEPFQYGSATLGRLLAPMLLWRRGKTEGPVLCLAVGLKACQWVDRRRLPLPDWIEAFCQAVTGAAAHGLERHRQLVLAEQMLARQAAGRRRSSRLPDLARLLLDYPLVSAPMAAKDLHMSQEGVGGLLEQLVQAGAVRELTGRSRYRAFGIL